jgi:hypothetical protein
MAQYNYASPVGAALSSVGNSLMEQLMLREQMKRQAQLDALAQQQAEQRATQEKARLDFDRERAGVSAMNDAADRNFRDREFARLEQQDAAEASANANRVGIRQMIGDRLNMGPVGADDARSLAGMAYGAELPVPGIIDQALKPPAPRRTTSLSEGSILVDEDTGEPIAKGLPKREPAGVDSRNPIAVIGPDGQPVLVPPSQAVGKRPASTREQGRPVTSGDANRIADLDTSLNDLDVLEKEVTGMTGTGSRIGAALPNVVTELTGWGADSKSRQAVIDRVKQVIGKALEGGVLRKEDEEKYKKILPTIGDDPTVAASKIAGLKQAIEQRRGTSLDSYADAGYDVERYRKREDAAARARALIEARRKAR